MQLKDVQPSNKRKQTKRVGRGSGSGHGKTSCRGMKGAKSRSGRLWYIGMEGGNVPFYRKLPKRGFNHYKRNPFQIVNIKDLSERFAADDEVTPNALFEKSLIKNPNKPVKILGKGTLDKALQVSAHQFSEIARKAIEEKGGKIQCLSL
jgi:large subunit ribosomal protein L15